MKRLLLYVHFNKYNQLSSHVIYQLKKMRPLFSNLVFISNSQVKSEDLDFLTDSGLINYFIQRNNIGYDFAAWHDGMEFIRFDNLNAYDSITVMNDTCFGPLWDMTTYYDRYENDETVDFWGMTNHQAVKTRDVSIEEHLQSYFISFKSSIIQSEVFHYFWKSIENHVDIQHVIDKYETQYTRLFTRAGFNYQSVLNTLLLKNDYYHSNFTIHYPHILLDKKVPFIKIKSFDLVQYLSPYTLQAIERLSNYPIQLITSHLTKISKPTPPYLIATKILPVQDRTISKDKKIAVHLHVYYVDLFEEFLKAFESFNFKYDLLLTTDNDTKKEQLEEVLLREVRSGKIFVTGEKGRDVLPMFKLKDQLAEYDYIGHFHTKKSPEYPYWVGDSWRDELFSMLIHPADSILANLDQNKELGLVIADIPSFFHYTRIVDPWNENKFAKDMNRLWKKMDLNRALDFESFDTFIMSYGTYIWFRYDALKPLFELNLTDKDMPDEPLPQHTILHSIERILVYIAWAKDYDYAISKNNVYITPFVDNNVLNIRSDRQSHTYIDFDQVGGITGALKYIIIGPGSAVKYIIRRIKKKISEYF